MLLILLLINRKQISNFFLKKSLLSALFERGSHHRFPKVFKTAGNINKEVIKACVSIDVRMVYGDI